MPAPVPGQLDVAQTYNDGWRGWPLRPHDGQHPIRGSFLDPRPDPGLGAIYHDGVDIGVRDDRPEAGAPRSRTHRIYAIEGGRVTAATGPGVRGLAHRTTHTASRSRWFNSRAAASSSAAASFARSR